MNTAEIHGITSSCPCRWLGFPTLQWCNSTIFSIFLVVGTLSTIIWMFCTIAAFCVDDLVVIVSFLLSDFLDFFSAYCNTFTARTDLSPLSPKRMFDTNLFTLTARIGISYVSRILGCILACCWHCSSCHGSLGPIPGCFSSRPSVPCSSAHLLADCFSDPRSPIAGCDRIHVSCSWHHAADFFFFTSLLSRFLVSTRARHPRSLASSRLTATFWSSSSPSHHFRAASCATSRLVCSSSSILW